MSVYIGPDGNVWANGKPIPMTQIYTASTAASSTDKMPTIEELHALVKKFKPPEVIVPAFTLIPQNGFNPPPEFMEYLNAKLEKYLIEQLFAVPPLLVSPPPFVPIEAPRRQLDHDDCHLFARPETKDRGQQFDEQEILRASSGIRSAYVWSETLKAHVRLGEDLKRHD